MPAVYNVTRWEFDLQPPSQCGSTIAYISWSKHTCTMQAFHSITKREREREREKKKNGDEGTLVLTVAINRWPKQNVKPSNNVRKTRTHTQDLLVGKVNTEAPCTQSEPGAPSPWLYMLARKPGEWKKRGKIQSIPAERENVVSTKKCTRTEKAQTLILATLLCGNLY